MKGSSAAHTKLLHDILADVGAMPGVVIGANASGLARYAAARSGKAFFVPYGWPTKGGPDLLAAIAPFGRLVALEAKTGEADLTADQRACHAALRAVGVVIETVRSVAEARAVIVAAAATTKHVRRSAGPLELDGELADLGVDERRVLLVLARRLLAGQRHYGRLDVATDRRDWRRERSEEIADLLIYSAIAELAEATR